jgi:hypothetical protein
MKQQITRFNNLLLLLLLTALSAPAQHKQKKTKPSAPLNLTVNPTVLGIVQAASINEASGLAASKALPGHYWTHNDSGGEPEVYLLDNTAQLVSVVQLKGVSNRDWEDIAEGIGPVPHQQYVYVGDIGNNAHLDVHTHIYRFPVPAQLPGKQFTVKPDVLKIKYPDGPRDAESLMIDPIGNSIYIISKREKQVKLYKVPSLHFKDGDKVKLKEVGTLPYTWITAGEISQDGHHIIIKDKSNIYYWHRKQGETVETAMSRPATILPYIPEIQGEGLTFKTDNTGYLTISEGKRPALYFYPHLFK